MVVVVVLQFGCTSDDPDQPISQATPPFAESAPSDGLGSDAPAPELAAWSCEGAQPFDLYDAALDGLVNEVNGLLSDCVGGPQAGPHDDVALQKAAYASHPEVVTVLLGFGADPAYQDGQGESAFAWASRPVGDVVNEHIDVAKAAIVGHLLEAAPRASLDTRGEFGRTALHYAAGAGFTQVVMVLMQAGASLEVRTDEQFTPLMVAAGAGSGDVVSLLLDGGADAEARNGEGQTASDIARREGNERVVELIDTRSP